MPNTLPQYNERAWAIELITEINIYSRSRSRAIARAGGEYTLADSSGRVFPDVLLFGDSGGGIVLHGWELKMPNTPISDGDFLGNAEKKARRLGVNSFLVWNADEAQLYHKSESDNFIILKAWPRTNLRNPEDVRNNKTVWLTLLHQILQDINDLLESGNISGATPTVVIRDELFLDYLRFFTDSLASEVKNVCIRSATFSAELDSWWVINEIEHSGSSKYQGIARVNIINWINRFLFAHYLKRFHSSARMVESIDKGTTPRQAVAVFDSITNTCDFLNVFKLALGQEYIDSNTWNALIELNLLLKDFRLDSISQKSFHQILDGVLAYSRKKLAGQFATPKSLSELLVRIGMEDRRGQVLDPCCGTGTIIRAAYDLKREVGLSIPEALVSTWGSDKFAFPLQLCSIALSDPLGMGEVIQVFQHDAFDLRPDTSITFSDPNNGNHITRIIPPMNSILSNLPFVRFENNKSINPLIRQCADELVVELGEHGGIDGRADLYAYLLLKLRHLSGVSGRIAVIVSNSWLGTNWGERFRQILFRYFKLLRIVISGSGRWFTNAKVVTTILVLEKRTDITLADSSESSNEVIDFITTTEHIENWQSIDGGVATIANAILLPGTTSACIRKCSHKRSQLEQLEALGFGWTSFFVNLDWVNLITNNLLPANQFFDIHRGERRGWDQLFYPSPGHEIESQYIRPVLLSSRNIDRLIANADGDAFCCPEDVSTLIRLGHSGAISWIRKFENGTNERGIPLIKSLAKAHCYWYEMEPNALADFVVSMNPDKRLCVHRLELRSFVNQRLMRFTVKEGVDVDLDLLHALMNSIIGMFQIEAAGFGRGLGALDLNPTKLNKQFHLLNPNNISTLDRQAILSAFRPLLERPIYDLPEEIASVDRQNFDQVVLSVFGAHDRKNEIYEQLLRLYSIRHTARE